MLILGLTGSIGMGKSRAARAFRRLGVPVFDADQMVHRLMERGGGAVSSVERAFPGTVREGAVDRVALGARVFGKSDELRRLERILHPRVRAACARFLKRARARRDAMVVLDIPLLLETGGDANCDYTAVVTAPHFVQRARVLARRGMTEEKFAAVLTQQMPDAEKRRRADFVIPTGNSFRYSFDVIRDIVLLLTGVCPAPTQDLR
ncbi:MAG: dephospho-CoA kinase [Proteobacteria bacterium]|nr:dephospho-CoA kinase [Pseudomonadota bacterium]